MEKETYSDGGNQMSRQKEYKKSTTVSRRLHRNAQEFLPGGDTRSATYHNPYPTYVKSANGCHLITVDDERLVDFVNNYTQSVLGHAPQKPVEAITNRVRQGNGLGAPTTEVIELAKLLSNRVPSIEKVRFANSGTEATLNAIRGAMCYTGRENILKVQGGYHGTHDSVEVGVDKPGRANRGIPNDVEERVHTVQFNNLESLYNKFTELGDDLACFIVEPVLGAGGMIQANKEFLETARDLTEENGAVLIFDEIMTFRLDTGGAQERYGVIPDLTTLGKLIGGGLPVGAFGGREKIMEVFHPENGEVSHSGTFNGNPATMAGGIASLEELDQKTISKINARGKHIRSGLRDMIESQGLSVEITGDGSLFAWHFTDDVVRDAEASTVGCEHARELYFELRSENIYVAPRGMGNVSTEIGKKEIKHFLDGFEKSIRNLNI